MEQQNVKMVSKVLGWFILQINLHANRLNLDVGVVI